MDETLNREAQGTPKTKVCEACGKEFACFSPRGPCWCEDVKVSSETLAELRVKYRECLCPECLKDAAREQFV